MGCARICANKARVINLFGVLHQMIGTQMSVALRCIEVNLTVQFLKGEQRHTGLNLTTRPSVA